MTWAELRVMVFRHLDLPENTTGDLKSGIEQSLFAIYEEMIVDFPPIELLEVAGPVAVTSTTQSIALGDEGFGIVDEGHISDVGIDFSPEVGTAQGGSTTTITLAAAGSGVDDFYSDKLATIRIIGGTGSGQSGRTITDYNGTTKEATVSPAWDTAPDSTSQYVISLEEDEIIEEVSYLTYKRQLSTRYGDVRDGYHWTLDPEDNIAFTTRPGANDVWDAYLYYYRQPAAFADDSSPEIHQRHHKTIAYGAMGLYPQLFRGERRENFQTFARHYRTGIMRFQKERRTIKASKKMKNRQTKVGRGQIRWS